METLGTTLGETGTVMEESTMMQNNPEMSRGALRLQNQLERLRLEVVKSRAALQAIQRQGGATEQMESLNNGAEEEIGERLAALNKQRTEALLSFRGIQMAMQAGQANQALSRALNLDREGEIKLEAEEEEYVRSLLEEQRELAGTLSQSNREEVEKEVEVMGKQAELTRMYCSYKELASKAVNSRLENKEAWDEQTKKTERALKEGDQRLNQLRFTIQKFMISHDKFGLQFDEETNEELQALLVRCGRWPEDLRAKKLELDSTPAAAADVAME